MSDQWKGCRLVLGSLALALIATPVRAQEPMTAAPKNYRLEFDNEFVRVIRASLAPRDHVPVHQHPTMSTVYVYLTDAGPTRFTHITPSYTIERAPVRAGGIRYNRNFHIETHVVDNLSDAPSEYLRIEMKTTPDSPHPDVRSAPDDATPIEDAQVRISRHVCAADSSCEVPSRPAVLVWMGERGVTWFEPGVTAPRRNAGQSALQQIWIELKTKPAK